MFQRFFLGTVLLFSLPLLSLGGQPTSKGDPALTPAEALKAVGQPEVLVELTVQAAKNRLNKRGVVYLDSAAEFTDPDNLGIALSVGAAAQLEAQGIEDPAAHFLGKKIRVRGCVMRLEDRVYLPVLDAGKIEIVKE